MTTFVKVLSKPLGRSLARTATLNSLAVLSTFSGRELFPFCDYTIVHDQLAMQFGFLGDGVLNRQGQT